MTLKRILAVAIASLLLVAANSELQAQTSHRPLNRVGRFLGLGWGNGFHTRTPGPSVGYYSPYSQHNSTLVYSNQFQQQRPVHPSWRPSFTVPNFRPSTPQMPTQANGLWPQPRQPMQRPVNNFQKRHRVLQPKPPTRPAPPVNLYDAEELEIPQAFRPDDNR